MYQFLLSSLLICSFFFLPLPFSSVSCLIPPSTLSLTSCLSLILMSGSWPVPMNNGRDAAYLTFFFYPFLSLLFIFLYIFVLSNTQWLYFSDLVKCIHTSTCILLALSSTLNLSPDRGKKTMKRDDLSVHLFKLR